MSDQILQAENGLSSPAQKDPQQDPKMSVPTYTSVPGLLNSLITATMFPDPGQPGTYNIEVKIMAYGSPNTQMLTLDTLMSVAPGELRPMNSAATSLPPSSDDLAAQITVTGLGLRLSGDSNQGFTVSLEPLDGTNGSGNINLSWTIGSLDMEMTDPPFYV